MSTSEPAAGIPPVGSSVDFNQQSDLWPSLIAVSVISLVIMTVSLSVKVYAKIIKSRALGLEEYLSIAAVLIMIVWTVVYDVASHLGVSKHQWNVRVSDIPHIFNLLNICDILYGPMLLVAKLSLLLQLHRHFLGLNRPKYHLKWLVYSTGVIIAGYYFSCIFQFALQCIPRHGLWDPSVHPKCANAPALTFAAGAFGLLTNLLLYILLLCLIYIAGSNQLGGWPALLPVHIVALFGIAASTATLYYRVPFMDPSVDLTYHVAIVGIWAMAEYAAIILVGCVSSCGIWTNKRGKMEELSKSSTPEV
ncbi:hypothetical protein IQ07DRAFT_636310 [Pyrenochaeta sp. DS3sAY3a]|nr:hypothetical protein IQ07DRAFT_636310 [Pyrenochaeta sp. DS3sAY3a]